jgi:surface antigen-like variable number repeat protein
MRCQCMQMAVLVTICLLCGKAATHAQSSDWDTVPEMEISRLCPTYSPSDQIPSIPDISIAEMTFSGALQMSLTDQQQVADSVKQQTHGHSLDDVTDEALERVRSGWQNRGYFKVQVQGEGRTLTSSPVDRRIAIDFQVDEGLQYRLGQIKFEHNKAISNIEVLRSLFPIKDSDILSREKVADGMDNLRKAYGDLGYINSTFVPQILFDEDNGLISLDIDADEGKQFYLTRVDILGLEESTRDEALKDAPIGRIYSQRLFELFLRKHASLFGFMGDDPSHITKRPNERTGEVLIIVDARLCSAK